MQEVYVTLEEAATLEEIKYNSFVQMLKRDTDNQYITKLEELEGGGKARKYVAVSSLSDTAQKAYREIAKLRELTEQDPVEVSGVPVPPTPPWYVNTDLDWYIENYKEYYYKAVELGNIIRDFLNYSEENRTAHAEAFAKEFLGKGQRTLYRYTKSYLEASAWAIEKSKQDGGSYEFFKVLSLCRKPKEAGMFPSFTEEVKQVIKNIWFNKEFAGNQGTREMLYGKLQAVADINKWDKIPSYQSVARYISYLMEDECMRNAWYLAAFGQRDYKNKVMVKAVRDTTALKVMEIVMGDEHTFDCWVAYTNPNGKISAIKPKLCAWVDTRSRMILGDVICKDPNSDILKESLLKMICSEPGGLPEYLYIDNGKDYTGIAMTGRKRNKRSSMEDASESEINGNETAFDDMTRGFYKSIGIKDDHRALPYEPWSKGQIERFFGGVCSQFTKWMTSYTGTLTGSKTSAKVHKDIKKMLDTDKLLTMDEFYALWNNWLHDVYEHKEHSQLKRLKEKHKTPYDLFMNEERYFKAIPPKSYLTMLMKKSESVLVRNIGICRFGYEYRADELCDYIGMKVNIKYDPEDAAVIYVFDKKGHGICEARSQELLLIAPKVSQKALEEHMKSQKRQLKSDREKLADANRPFEELNDQYIGFSTVTGGIDLMMGKTGTKTNKVVSMPTDRTYTQNASMRKQQEEADYESEYMNRQAENALRKLRAIGE